MIRKLRISLLLGGLFAGSAVFAGGADHQSSEAAEVTAPASPHQSQTVQDPYARPDTTLPSDSHPVPSGAAGATTDHPGMGGMPPAGSEDSGSGTAGALSPGEGDATSPRTQHQSEAVQEPQAAPDPTQPPETATQPRSPHQAEAVTEPDESARGGLPGSGATGSSGGASGGEMKQ